MTREEFEKFQENLHWNVVGLMNDKGKEYCHGQSRFENFETEARELEVDPLLVAFIFFKKHYRAILYYIKYGHLESNETIQSRFHDAIAYLELMAGMAADREESKLTEKINVQQHSGSNIGRAPDERTYARNLRPII